MEIRTKSIFDRKSQEDGYRVCVMRFVRKDYDFDLWVQDLAPSVGLLNSYKNRSLSWEQYKKGYLEEMKVQGNAVIRLMKIIRERKVVTLLCAEKDDTYCHRRLLKDYMQQIMADEFPL